MSALKHMQLNIIAYNRRYLKKMKANDYKKRGTASLRPPSRRKRIRDASRARKTPFMSATSYPPTGFPRSTFGDGGLNCRVRNGIG